MTEPLAAHLSCPKCSNGASLPVTAWRCPDCGGPLSWPVPGRFGADDLDGAQSFIWRYQPALPPVSSRISFGEQATPLTTLDLAGATISAKLESLNPTGSFKDRGCALLVNALAGSGVTRLVEDSSGNAAASLAGYAARAGIPCTIFAPATASEGKLIQAAAYGADVVRVKGTRADVAKAAEAAHDPERGVIYASHNWHPWFVSGVATIALELWEQRNRTAPEALIAPAGSGSIILGAFSAFSMLLSAGEIDRLPRLYAAQPAACSPFARAMQAGGTTVEPFDQQPTLAEGASITSPVRGNEVLAALRASDGGAVAISEDDIAAETLATARQGIFIEPTSALAPAAAAKLIADGAIPASEDTVVIITGSGLKAPGAIAGILEQSAV